MTIYARKSRPPPPASSRRKAASTRRRSAARCANCWATSGPRPFPTTPKSNASCGVTCGSSKPDTHAKRLAGLRPLARSMMERLAEFEPHLTGAVLNGTATEHSDIHLHLYVDSAKDVEVFLMNAGVDFDVDEGPSDERPQHARAPGFPDAGAAGHRPAAADGPDRLSICTSTRATPSGSPRARRRIAAIEPDLHPVEACGPRGPGRRASACIEDTGQ